MTYNSLSTWIHLVTSGIDMWLLVNFKNDWIIILLKWISCWTKTFIDVTKIFHYMVDNKTLVLIFLLHTFSWWFSWLKKWLKNSASLDYFDQTLLLQISIFFSIETVITLSLLVIFAWKYLIHIYDELVGSQSFLLTNFIHIFQKCYSFGKEKTVVFFVFVNSLITFTVFMTQQIYFFLKNKSNNNSSPMLFEQFTTIRVKNHHMYILLQRLLKELRNPFY